MIRVSMDFTASTWAELRFAIAMAESAIVQTHEDCSGSTAEWTYVVRVGPSKEVSQPTPPTSPAPAEE